MISVLELEQSGYALFMDSMKRKTEIPISADAYKGTWQKCIRTPLGKKYFINIDHWDFSNSQWKDRVPNQGPGFSAHAQFESKEGMFNIELMHCEDKTIDSIETWFEKQWMGNSCMYYEKNNCY